MLNHLRSHDWEPLERPACACAEHVEDLHGLAIPSVFDGREPMTVLDLINCRALGTQPLPKRDRWLEIFEQDESSETIGPFHWGLWAGDEVRGSYNDDAELPLDQSIAARPGVERVEWLDREEFFIGAPSLCASGMLAAVARALEDPRVR